MLRQVLRRGGIDEASADLRGPARVRACHERDVAGGTPHVPDHPQQLRRTFSAVRPDGVGLELDQPFGDL